MALLNYSLPDDEHESALLSAIVVLGLKDNYLSKGFAQAHEFLPTMSALITASKALVVYCALVEHRASRHQPERLLVHKLVKDKAERFMRLSDYNNMVSPMSCMLHLRTLAITFAC